VIYPLAFPSLAPASYKLILNRRQSVAQSPWTYKQSTTGGGFQWMLEWAWPPMTWAKAENIQGWLQSLDGQNGSFRFAPRQPFQFGNVSTTLAIIGYSYNSTISVKGWGANAATSLRKGQYFQIGDQLLQIVEAGAFADATGTTTIGFAPTLRRQFPAGTVVNFVNPTGVFGLNTSDGAGYSLTPDRAPEFGPVQAREII
jgi:hypothetical protein